MTKKAKLPNPDEVREGLGVLLNLNEQNQTMYQRIQINNKMYERVHKQLSKMLERGRHYAHADGRAWSVFEKLAQLAGIEGGHYAPEGPGYIKEDQTLLRQAVKTARGLLKAMEADEKKAAAEAAKLVLKKAKKPTKKPSPSTPPATPAEPTPAEEAPLGI